MCVCVCVGDEKCIRNNGPTIRKDTMSPSFNLLTLANIGNDSFPVEWLCFITLTMTCARTHTRTLHDTKLKRFYGVHFYGVNYLIWNNVKNKIVSLKKENKRLKCFTVIYFSPSTLKLSISSVRALFLLYSFFKSN